MVIPERNRSALIQKLTEKGRPCIDFRTLVDYEMMRVMQAFGNNCPIRVEVIPLAEEGQPYMHLSKRPDLGLPEKIIGIVPMGQVYVQIRSEAKDLTHFWTTVREIHSENSRK